MDKFNQILYLWVACVSGEGRKRSQVSLVGTSEISLGSKEVDLANMVATLKTPAGSSEPVLLKKMKDGTLGRVTLLCVYCFNLTQKYVPVLSE